jgi:hypothetical protein
MSKNMRSQRDVQIDEGVRAVREWQRGFGAHLDEFSANCLTVKGNEYLREKVSFAMEEDKVREIVTAALAIGY